MTGRHGTDELSLALLVTGLVLSLLYVALEWIHYDEAAEADGIDLDEIIHENDLIPMSNVEKLVQVEQKIEPSVTEQVKVVEDNVELKQPDDLDKMTDDGTDKETLPAPPKDDDETKALAPIGVDMNDNPLNFRVVEDLPQFPGGAVELMKWLTKNLHYPPAAQHARVQGKVMAEFYIEKDGSVTGIMLTEKLHPACDREALRVLKMMPKWKAGVQNGKPCRTKVVIPIVFKM